MSEQELLLLSNFVYLDGSVKNAEGVSIAEILDRYRNPSGGFDTESISGIGIGGGMKEDEAVKLLKEIDAMPDSFKSVKSVSMVDDVELRGVCFEDSDGKATVVFRGTGGTYEAWRDNVIGEYLPDTAIQKRALEWVNGNCSGYDELTVTGHSKGGNLAMYVTVLSAGLVASCVSFDGQGFSDAFLENYSKEIAMARDKIKSVSAYNDFVNILLNSVAGEQIYVENTESGVNAHSSFYLYESNEYDENGRIVSKTDQSLLTRALKRVTDGMADSMDRMPGEGNKRISDLLAAFVASLMSDNHGTLSEAASIGIAGADMAAYLYGQLPIYSGGVEDVSISTFLSELKDDAFVNAASLFEEEKDYTNSVICRLDDFDYNIMNGTEISRYVNREMQGIKDRLSKHSADAMSFASALTDIHRMYSEKEAKLAEMFRT